MKNEDIYSELSVKCRVDIQLDLYLYSYIITNWIWRHGPTPPHHWAQLTAEIYLSAQNMTKSTRLHFLVFLQTACLINYYCGETSFASEKMMLKYLIPRQSEENEDILKNMSELNVKEWNGNAVGLS